MARKYEQRQRARARLETRRRITEATVELHRTIGPARTTISAIAERAGVQRLTVYRHFPDERALFAACGELWSRESPPPDPAGWSDPTEALTELYGWYRRNADVIGNVQHDAPAMPVLAEVADYGPYLRACREALLSPGATRRARAAAGHALEFSTWRSLTAQGLSDREAAALMSALVEG
ncbi:MAG: TetR/AcrR family transcriptional regulator [Solirubrobacteraceae bacterium]